MHPGAQPAWLEDRGVGRSRREGCLRRLRPAGVATEEGRGSPWEGALQLTSISDAAASRVRAPIERSPLLHSGGSQPGHGSGAA